MYNHYYVNKNPQSSGEHEVHTNNCSHSPDASNRDYLGYFDKCKDAIEKAKTIYDNVDGCYWCIKECHTK